MPSGFDEFSLALFTTLSPAGVIAFIFVAAPVLFFEKGKPLRTKLNRYLSVPIAFVLVGFIASATHLGTPSNALHVFSGVGRSPLSNEVLLAIVFLLLAGSYWMMSFKEKFPLVLAKAWLTLACLAGVLFIIMTSLAYSVDSVPTWNTVYAPINLYFSAFLAGPVIALLSCSLAGYLSKRYARFLVGVSVVALVVGAYFLFAQEAGLSDIANNEIIASLLVPDYFTIICIHCIMAAAGIVCTGLSLRADSSNRKRLLLQAIACVLLISAIFGTRIVFYSLHMTVGF